MKKRLISENLKRATEVIKSDRIGVSCNIEGLISKEIENLLNDFFSLSQEVVTVIEVNNSGYNITIKTKAKSVKQLKIIG